MVIFSSIFFSQWKQFREAWVVGYYGILFFPPSIFYCISSDFSDLPDMTGEHTNLSVVLEHR